MCAVRLLLALAAFVLGAGGEIIVLPIEEEFDDRLSSFGASLPLEGLRGFLVAGVPKDGCRPLAPPPADDNFTGKWIVLLARYNCSFEAKVRNAQAAGYDAAIVHNNDTSLETMSAKNAVGIRIPSVFVNNETGVELEINYTYKNDFYIVMNREVPFDINTHLLLPFAVVVGLCLVTMVICMIVKWVNARRRSQRHRLPNSALKKIPTCCYSKGDPYDTCAICLDDYLEGDKLRVLPCAHAYHCKCIDPWLTKNRRVCPVCKRRVFAAGERRALAAGERRRAPWQSRSESDTESDDSTSPLVTNTVATQGGTFVTQRENPFMAAQRFMARLRQSRSAAGRPADETSDAHPEPEVTASEEVPEQYGDGGEGDNVKAGPAAAAAPFLSGVLNLRSNHFGRGETDDTEPLVTAQSSLPTQTVVAERTRRNRRARSGRRHRSNSDATSSGVRPPPSQEHSNNGSNSGRGEIGVAALPNTNVAPDRYVV